MYAEPVDLSLRWRAANARTSDERTRTVRRASRVWWIIDRSLKSRSIDFAIATASVDDLRVWRYADFPGWRHTCDPAAFDNYGPILQELPGPCVNDGAPFNDQDVRTRLCGHSESKQDGKRHFRHANVGSRRCVSECQVTHRSESNCRDDRPKSDVGLRQPHHERRTTVEIILDGDRAAMRLHDAFRDTQAKTIATRLLGP
jgi:hypothetical protein